MRLSDLILLTYNEFTLAKFLSESDKPLTISEIYRPLWQSSHYWGRKDRTTPTGVWDRTRIKLALKRLLGFRLVSVADAPWLDNGWEEFVSGFDQPQPKNSIVPYFSYFLSPEQKELLKTVSVVKCAVVGSRGTGRRGRPRIYRNNAERQKAYRQRKALQKSLPKK